MAVSANGDGALPGGRPGLTASEDRELRQLAWFARAGHLSEKSAARLAELIARDRREEIRDPRPNPSDSADDRRATVPAPAPDRTALYTCPNCGVALPDPHALGAPEMDPSRLVFKSTEEPG